MNKLDIEKIITEATNRSAFNAFISMGLNSEKMWETPIIGFAKGDDEHFSLFKRDIGDFYWLPSEAYKLKFTNSNLLDGELSVISIGFPQTFRTKEDQKNSINLPCERWLRTRGEWEKMILEINKEIITRFKENGINAVAIDEIKEFSRHISKKEGLASNWSHRHTAYVAGLGTFGLSDGLITEKGKAMRFTSIIIDKPLEGDIRKYSNHNEYCKFYKDGSCKACIKRCPVGAINEDGHDKEKCSSYLIKIKEEIGPDFVRNSDYISGCGLCQTKIPCQDKIPF